LVKQLLDMAALEASDARPFKTQAQVALSSTDGAVHANALRAIRMKV
jgi:hypothetical protein